MVEAVAVVLVLAMLFVSVVFLGGLYKAKLFAMIAIGCDILFWIGMIIYFVFVVGLVAMSGSR